LHYIQRNSLEDYIAAMCKTAISSDADEARWDCPS